MSNPSLQVEPWAEICILNKKQRKKLRVLWFPSRHVFIWDSCFASSSIYPQLFDLIICKCLMWLMSSLKPDGVKPTAGKQVRVKRLPHVILWKETPFKEEDMFHFVHFSCAVEALLCSCEVLTGTTPGKETQTFKCTEHEHCWWKTKAFTSAFVCVWFLSRWSAVTSTVTQQ